MSRKYNLLWIDDEFNGRMKDNLKTAKEKYSEIFNIEPVTNIEHFKDQLNRTDITWHAFLCDYNNIKESKGGRPRGYTSTLLEIIEGANNTSYGKTPRFTLSGAIKTDESTEIDEGEADKELGRAGFIQNRRNSKHYWKKNPEGDDVWTVVFDDIKEYLDSTFSRENIQVVMKELYADGFRALHNLVANDNEANGYEKIYLDILCGNKNDLPSKATNIRKSIEAAYRMLVGEELVPSGKKINELITLFTKDGEIYKDHQIIVLSQELCDVLEYILPRIQECAHPNNPNNKTHFVDHLTSNGDSYIMQSFAIAALDILKCLNEFRKNNKGKSWYGDIKATVTEFDASGKYAIATTKDGKKIAFNHNNIYKKNDDVIIANISLSPNTNKNLKDVSLFSTNVRRAPQNSI